MPIDEMYRAPYRFGSFYHIFNRAVQGQNFFYKSSDYVRFLDNFRKYLGSILYLYTWALIPNHFHFQVSVKPMEECGFTNEELKLIEQDPDRSIDLIITRRFKNFFISSSWWLKRKYGIKTNVFSQHYKHVHIDLGAYFSELVYYIHHNPAHHGITADWQSYIWTSFQDIIRGYHGTQETKFLMEWFGGLEGFLEFHENKEKSLYHCPFDL